MNNLITLIIISGCLQACSSMKEDSMSKEEMKRIVYLSQDDLMCFSQLRQQLLTDSAVIGKQNIEVQPAIGRREWMTTNSYYLNRLDSVKYAILFSKLKGKLVDDIMINNKGDVIFRIKQNTERYWDSYNITYSHDIISADYQYPITKVFNMVDTVFVDSTINRNWRYISYKVLTGH